MTTSGTYSFSPSLAELVLSAYSRCGIRRTALLQEHFADARMESNLLLGEWANKGINLWTIDQQTISLVQGTATYALSPETVLILDGFIRTTSSGINTDRLIFPISRTDYASLASKQQQAPPTVFWFDRLSTPTITFWQVPDGNGPYQFVYYQMRQTQDANLPGGLNVEIPWRFLDAFGWSLAERLAIIYAPDRAQGLAMKAKESWGIAAGANVEDVPLFVTPSLQGYFR
jgi:hypothetical protein